MSEMIKMTGYNVRQNSMCKKKKVIIIIINLSNYGTIFSKVKSENPNSFN